MFAPARQSAATSRNRLETVFSNAMGGIADFREPSTAAEINLADPALIAKQQLVNNFEQA